MRSLTSFFLLFLLTPLAATAAEPSRPAVESSVLWTSGAYQYDGAGNIRAIGTDTYVYDSAGRLVRGSADKQRTGADNVQSYAYDSFGNMLSIQTAGANCAGNVDCGAAVTVSHTTNHLTSDAAAYDDAGNLRTIGATYQYTWDATGMMVSQSGGSPFARQYIYTASDERLATRAGTAWQWTLRDEGNRVVRVLTSTDPQNGTPGTTNWQWTEDNVFAAARLASSVGPYGRRHYHTDHLGSPRLITDDYGRRLADHAYYPYGAALNLPSETPEQHLKFTGHERDVMADVHALDYMHARYYTAGMARFLSVDPVIGQGAMRSPQMWNRYSYVANSPLRYADPDGRLLQLSECVKSPTSSGCIGQYNLLLSTFGKQSGDAAKYLSIGKYGVISITGMSGHAFAAKFGLMGRATNYLVSNHAAMFTINTGHTGGLANFDPREGGGGNINVDVAAFKGGQMLGGVNVSATEALVHEMAHGVSTLIQGHAEALNAAAGTSMLTKSSPRNEAYATVFENAWRRATMGLGVAIRDGYVVPGDVRDIPSPNLFP